MHIDELAGLMARLRAEFREMPGLQLTSAQAARLFGIDGSLCERLLEDLTEEGVLDRRRDGRYGLPESSERQRGAGKAR